jgi:hypothetical protein
MKLISSSSNVSSTFPQYPVFNSTGINSTASFFGDAHLSQKEIEKVVEAAFDTGDITILHEGTCPIRKEGFCLLLRIRYTRCFLTTKTMNHALFVLCFRLHSEACFQRVHKTICVGKNAATCTFQGGFSDKNHV